MSYASRDDLIKAFGQAEVDNLIAAGRDDGEALDYADAEINSRAAVRYAVPLALDTAPADTRTIVIGKACDIARWRLYAGAADPEVKDRYEQAMAWLGALAAGKALLPGLELAASDGTAAAGQSPARYGRSKSGFDWAGYGC